MIVRCVGTVLFMASVASSALAQQASAPVGPFVFAANDKVSLKPDGSYLFNHTDGGLVFEAQIAPDVRIVDNFGSALERVLGKDRPRVFAYSVYGTFLTRLRMFDEASNPVRSPSYMPKGTVQLAWLRNLSGENFADNEAEFKRGPIEMWLINAIPFGHHSNGQNGCLFKNQTRQDGECVPEPPAAPAATDINTDNGSFSTTYMRIGLVYRRLHPDGDDDVETRAVTRREWGLGGSVEMNPSGYVGGSISDSLRPLYGPTRYRLNADLTVGNMRLLPKFWKRLEPGETEKPRTLHCGRAWVDGSFTLIQGGAESVNNVVTAEAACLPARWGGAGLFVRYYYGQDYYNAAFLENLNRVQFGVTFLQGKFLAFTPVP